MPIALSLMFPFAEAAGITLTGLGIAKATDVVMNYIQANPEKSKQILSTLKKASNLLCYRGRLVNIVRVF